MDTNDPMYMTAYDGDVKGGSDDDGNPNKFDVSFKVVGQSLSETGSYQMELEYTDGSYKLNNGGGHEEYEDLKQTITLRVTDKVTVATASGSTEFGDFVSAGIVRGNEMVLVRRYVEEGDWRGGRYWRDCQLDVLQETVEKAIANGGNYGQNIVEAVPTDPGAKFVNAKHGMVYERRTLLGLIDVLDDEEKRKVMDYVEVRCWRECKETSYERQHWIWKTLQACIYVQGIPLAQPPQ